MLKLPNAEGCNWGEGVASCVIFMSQEKFQTMIMQFFFGGERVGGGGVKEVYHGICASRELH